MTKHGFWFEGGRLSLDFVATSGVRSGELLPTPPTLARWLVAAGLTKRPPAVSEAQLKTAHRLRAALSRLSQASIGDGVLQPADIDLTNAAASLPPPLRSLCLRGGDLYGRQAAPNVDECLGAIARDAIDLLTGPQRTLLRRCAAEDCDTLYLDLSRGGRRKWCTTARCGNRTRVSAHRSRRKAMSPQ